MDKFEVRAEIAVNLTVEDIDDIMVGALEGGINHWCCEAEVVEKCRVADWGHEQIAVEESSSCMTQKERTSGS